MTWYHNGKELETMYMSQSDGYHDVLLNNGNTTFTNTLTIDPFTTSSVGNYTCVAKVKDSTAETTKNY